MQSGEFAAVLVDGRARVKCARAISESDSLRPGGWLFFHDWVSRSRYSDRLPELSQWYEFVQLIEHTRIGMAVFRKRNADG